MKPSEMSNEELVAMVRDWASSHMTVTDDYVMDEFDEIAARLRNSIPKPKNIHVVVYDGVNLVIDGKYVCDLSDRYSRHADYRRDVEQRLRTALGINDTEGGE